MGLIPLLLNMYARNQNRKNYRAAYDQERRERAQDRAAANAARAEAVRMKAVQPIPDSDSDIQAPSYPMMYNQKYNMSSLDRFLR